MRRLLGTGAIILGIVGLLASTVAAGFGVWAANRTSARIVRVCNRLEIGLGEVDAQLARVELRMDSIRSDLTKVRAAAETIDRETQDLPRVGARIEELVDRLIPALDRVDATADSVQSVAVGLRTVADIVDQFNDELDAPARARNAADKIDHAAESLSRLGSKVNTLKSDKVTQITRELATLAQEAVASSERLSEGLATAREVIGVVRERTTARRDSIVFWVFIAATANTMLWVWSGLGQLCLIAWGAKRFKSIGTTKTGGYRESGVKPPPSKGAGALIDS